MTLPKTLRVPGALLLAPSSLLLVLAACSSSKAPGENTGESTSALSYYRDVKPIIARKCEGCHTSGGIAPFALDSYASAKEHAAEMRDAVSAGRMPPWPPSEECTEYLGKRSLAADEKKALLDWIEQGSVEGKADEYVAPAHVLGLSRVDRTIAMPEEYTPKESPDDYRCFVIDWPETEAKFVTGFRARPGNGAIVHHVIAFVATPDQVPVYEALDAKDPGPGYKCFAGPGGNTVAPWLAGWAPGNPGADFPKNTGIRVSPGSKIVLQVHYNTSHAAHGGGSVTPDRTAMDLKVDSTVEKEAVLQPWTNPLWVRDRTMDIPAGEADVVHKFAFDPTTVLERVTSGKIPSGSSFTIWSAALHMHTHGTKARLSIQRSDKRDECLLDIPRWDFHWQGAYGLAEPKTFNPGDQLQVECHFDNSSSTIARNWGEGTDDEMCLGFFYMTK